ncbi:MAG: MFS transporter [Chloroflexota bacterium]|nr:MFS transporter [Chloroflexota bacterium]
MDQRHLVIVTFALMMGLFLASLEGTVVSTAMPTIVAQLGGLEIYSWVFSIYMLASTTTITLFGRLSDLYGRKPIYMVGVFLFLLGSALSGQASGMIELVLFRALQGLGAGALTPMAFTIIGDIFTLEQRARVQGFFSGVWGISSVVGPLVGGFLVDNVSWRWVFYLNIPFGLVAATLLWLFLEEPVEERGSRRIDFLGAILLTVSVLMLLYALLQGGTNWAWRDPRLLGLLASSLVLLAAFLWVEGQVSDPLIPLNLYRDRLFAAASAHGFVAGLALFGTMAYIPLFVQGVLGTSATRAGATLTPMVLGWVGGSIASGYLLLRVGPRRIAEGGMGSMVLGGFLLTRLGPTSPQWLALLSMLLMGLGMGLTITAYLVAVQNRVSRSRLGVATSALQFVRQIGGTIGVSLLGAVMAARLSQGLAMLPGGQDVDPQALLDRASGLTLPPAVAEAFQQLLADALHPAFYIALAATLIGLAIAFLTPRGTTQQLVAEGERGEGAVTASEVPPQKITEVRE